MTNEEITAKVTASLNLLNAAQDIEDYGWVPEGGGPNTVDPYGTYPRCPWTGLMRAIERDRIASKEDYEHYRAVINIAEQALVAVTGAIELSDFFLINDHQDLDKGKEWALKALRDAAFHVMNGAPVPDSVTGETDTDSIQEPESGTTTSAENPVKRLLKRLRLVK